MLMYFQLIFIKISLQADYVMMTAWLLDDADCSLPPGPVHFIGIGGMVIRSIGNPSSTSFKDYEVLVVQEKHGPSANFQDFWKLPGGLVDRNEEMSAAAIREVKEETGIEAVFDKICGVRESHNGTSSMTRKHSTDVYIICSMRLKDESKKTITKQDAEIADARWMNLDAWLNSSIYKNQRDPFARLMRASAEVAIGLRSGLVEVKHGGRGVAKQSIYVAAMSKL